MTDIDDFYSPPAKTAAWEILLNRLLAVPRPRRDLERRLRERGCPRETAAELLDRYELIGLIDDRAYALLYIDAKRDYGVLRLRAELSARGIARAHIDEALDECGVDEGERAACLIERWRGLPGMTGEKMRARLQRRGFSGAAVRAAFERLEEKFGPDEEYEADGSEWE